jgi:hypothetical protein
MLSMGFLPWTGLSPAEESKVGHGPAEAAILVFAARHSKRVLKSFRPTSIRAVRGSSFLAISIRANF